MKRTITAVFVALVATIVPASASTVVRVVDGDTFHAVYHGKDRAIRLACVDAPEARQPWGAVATAALRAKVTGRTVALDTIRLDRYGRTVATVHINRRNIGLELVRAGLAWDYRSLCTDPAFAAAEDAARAAHIGLWSDAHPISPSNWRKGLRT